MKVGRLPASALAVFEGGTANSNAGVRKANAGANMAAKPTRVLHAGGALPSPLGGLSRSAPTTTGETPRVLPTGNRSLDRGKRQARLYPLTALELGGVKNEWDKLPDTKAALKRQLSRRNAGSDRSLNASARKEPTGRVAYGRMNPIDRAHVYGEFTTPNAKAPGKEMPFGSVVSEVIAGEHRVPDAAPGDATGAVVFEKLLDLKPEYKGENIRYAYAPKDYQIHINDAGLLVNNRGLPISADNAKFVLDQYGNWFMARIFQNQFFHHSSLARGEPVGMAGYMHVKQGVLQTYNKRSGHYQPGAEHVEQFEAYLTTKKVQRAVPDKSLPQPSVAQRTGIDVASPIVYGDIPGNPRRGDVTSGNAPKAPSAWTAAKGPGSTYANDPSKREKLIGSR